MHVVPHVDRHSNSRGDSWSRVPVFVKRCSSFFLIVFVLKELFIFILICFYELSSTIYSILKLYYKIHLSLLKANYGVLFAFVCHNF